MLQIFVCEFSCLDLSLARYNPNSSSVYSSTLWILDEAKVLCRIDTASTSFLVQVFKMLNFTCMVLFYSVELHIIHFVIPSLDHHIVQHLVPPGPYTAESTGSLSCTWRKQHGICLSFFGGEFLASWCTSDEAHRDNNSYLFLVLKNRKEFFSKREKRKENGTFGINFADLLLGHKPKKNIFSLNFATIKQLFRCTITIYLTNYYLPTSQMVIHCWRVT